MLMLSIVKLNALTICCMVVIWFFLYLDACAGDIYCGQGGDTGSESIR